MQSPSLIKNSLRSVISLVDKLRDINLQSYIQLPKIVVVGSQSSGKSSLIQQIVGLDFLPRGSGVVTRRPLQIRMTYQEDLKQSIAKFQQLPNEKFTNFQKVKECIIYLTNKVCGERTNIVDKAIVLNIISSQCPNLTIIDLPGLTRIALPGQPHNIFQITKLMIQKYIKQQNTIILCVLGANQDITNDEVLHMARQIDKKGERTIGCLTKIDIMDRGADARLQLMNKGEVPLKLGYVGIKNRSQQDINQNKKVKQSLQQEKMYFSKSPIYSSLPLSCLGTSSLVDKLTKVLQQLIVNYLPVLLQKIRQKKHKLSQKIHQYGRPLPKTKQQQNLLIWQLCHTFLHNFKTSLSGIPTTLKSSSKLQKTYHHISQSLSQFLLHESTQNFQQYLKDHKIHFALRKFDTINQLGFPSMNTFLYLINPLLADLKMPMGQVLNNLVDHVVHMAEVIINQVVFEYVKFKEFLNMKIQDIVAQYKKKCSLFLENMLESEIKGIQYQKLDFDRSKLDPSKYSQLQLKNPMIPVLRRSVLNYYTNCVKNLRQLIPKNFKYLILTQSIKKIQFQIFQSCLSSTDKLQDWLQINNSTKKQRLNNQKQFDVIQKAQQFILTYSGFSRSISRESIGGTGAAQKKNKKRQQRGKQMESIMMKRKEIKQNKQFNKVLTQSNKKDQKGANFDFTRKVQYTAPKPDNKQVQQKEPINEKASQQKNDKFAYLFGTNQVDKIKKQQKPVQPPTQPPTQPQTQVPPQQLQQPHPQQQSNRKPIFPSPSTQQINLTFKQDQIIKQKYNQEMGKTTDKGVDQVFKNQKFQQQSKKAVQKGASTTVQKQFGVSDKTAVLLGQGAGWVWGQEKTQNIVKDQAKKQARDKTQI